MDGEKYAGPEEDCGDMTPTGFEPKAMIRRPERVTPERRRELLQFAVGLVEQVERKSEPHERHLVLQFFRWLADR